MKSIILTNNPKVNIETFYKEEVRLNETASQLEILFAARDMIHMGAKLIMHPMAGRVKPYETPYKSVFLEEGRGELDMISLTIIEDSIAETQKFLDGSFTMKYYDEVLPDLQFIDLELLRSGVEEHRRA